MHCLGSIPMIQKQVLPFLAMGPSVAYLPFCVFVSLFVTESIINIPSFIVNMKYVIMLMCELPPGGSGLMCSNSFFLVGINGIKWLNC